MKHILAAVALAACALPIAALADQVVNLNAQCANLVSPTTPLAAGNYQISVIGTNQGGKYNGWDFRTQNYNTSSAAPAPNSWTDTFSIVLGGVETTYSLAGNQLFGSATDALKGYQSAPLYVASANGVLSSTTTTPADGNGLLPNTVDLKILCGQTAKFTIPDNFFGDNWGGVSLKITPVAAVNVTPEPATFGLMAMVLAAGFAVLCRKRFATGKKS